MEKLCGAGPALQNRFHTTALCSPTRGCVAHWPQSPRKPGTAASPKPQRDMTATPASFRKSAGTGCRDPAAERLRHRLGRQETNNTPVWETSEIGPFDHWANGLGFDLLLRLSIPATLVSMNRSCSKNRNRVPRSNDPELPSLCRHRRPTRSVWIQKVKVIDPDRPFLPLCGPRRHPPRPHQAPKEWIDKFQGPVSTWGWDRYPRNKRSNVRSSLASFPADPRNSRPRPRRPSGLGHAQCRPENVCMRA